VLISRELYKDAFFLFLIAQLYLVIIIFPKSPKKNLKKLITQDTSDIEKELFVQYLNEEREKRKRIREEAIKAAESESPAEDVTDGNGKEENKTE